MLLSMGFSFGIVYLQFYDRFTTTYCIAIKPSEYYYLSWVLELLGGLFVIRVYPIKVIKFLYHKEVIILLLAPLVMLYTGKCLSEDQLPGNR